ncbi:hypothetical protein I310_01898 [Cryptococcus deuterogattii CA1014]|nr:hypothetical protein I310_01898 [Cryptococcus deuterogattii CA1014]KIS01224.1 hypothetical protein L804_01098 [Cryptococcus deuterogattii 2001/935-1]
MTNRVQLLHHPGSTHPSLSDGPDGFDRAWFMGKWDVVWSTLPMWRDKKEFEDLVEYRARSSTDGSKTYTSKCQNKEPSGRADDIAVKGTDTLSPASNGATFDWKGKGLLFFVHSHWEVLGYGKDVEQGLEWAVTYFSKTLFTPAGIDIYVRTIPFSSKPQNFTAREVLLQRLINEAQDNDVNSIRNLAKQGFRVPGNV